MAIEAGDQTIPTEAEALAPLAGTRAQRIQRLQVGLFGLGAMILLLALATIIIDQAKESEASTVPEAAATTEPEPTPTAQSNPLAEAGVVPELTTEAPAAEEQPPVAQGED